MPGDATRMLIVEDNPIDVQLLRYALKQESSWLTTTTVVDDGEKAIALLLDGSHERAKIDFVVLDLNLPKRDGAEVLHAIRADAALSRIPVAILSSSPLDVIKGRMRRANVAADCYFTKPMHIDDYVALGKQLNVCFRHATQGLECLGTACECKAAWNHREL